MSATNLEACVTSLKAIIETACSYPAANITDGRRSPSARKTPWAHIIRADSALPLLLAGARRREYVFEVELYRAGVDMQEEDALDEAVQADAEALRDALDGKGLTTFPTLTRIETIRCEILQRDDDGDTRTEQIARLRVTYPFFEVL